MGYNIEEWPSASAIMTFDDGDPLENPWVSGSPIPEAIEIAVHSPNWSKLFDANKRRIAEALPGIARNIEHVGSTAVPLLAAKPIIDIDLIVDDPSCEEAYVTRLTALGYVLTVREPSWYQHRMLRHDRPRINLHVFGRNCPEHARHLLFRDWLCDHPEHRTRYAQIKEEARIGTVTVQDYNRKKQTVVRAIYREIFESRGWNVA